MINIEEPSILGRMCMCCCTKENVLEIHIRKEDKNGRGSGIGFSLCADCRRELAEKIKEAEINENPTICGDCLCRICGQYLIEQRCQGCDSCTGKPVDLEEDCHGPGFKLDEEYDEDDPAVDGSLEDWTKEEK